MKKSKVIFSAPLCNRQLCRDTDYIQDNNRQTVKTIFYVPMLICLIAASLFAQETNKQNPNAKDKAVASFQVGNSLSGTSRIVPRTAQYLLYTLLPNGNKQISSLLTRTVNVSEQGGEPTISVTQRYDGKEKVSTDVSTVKRRTLEPLTYNSDLPNQKESFTFTPQLVQGTITPVTGEAKTVTKSLKERVFNAVVVQELIQSLPLKAGYAVSVKIYNPGKAFLSPTYRVARSERLKTANGTDIETWVIESGGTTLWVSKRTQDLMMMKVQLNNGSQFWKVRLYSNG